MAQSKITLYVDIVSPFAYIAFYLLKVCPVPYTQRVTRDINLYEADAMRRIPLRLSSVTSSMCPSSWVV
jgi:hypothetical protein